MKKPMKIENEFIRNCIFILFTISVLPSANTSNSVAPENFNYFEQCCLNNHPCTSVNEPVIVCGKQKAAYCEAFKKWQGTFFDKLVINIDCINVIAQSNHFYNESCLRDYSKIQSLINKITTIVIKLHDLLIENIFQFKNYDNDRKYNLSVIDGFSGNHFFNSDKINLKEILNIFEKLLLIEKCILHDIVNIELEKSKQCKYDLIGKYNNGSVLSINDFSSTVFLECFRLFLEEFCYANNKACDVERLLNFILHSDYFSKLITSMQNINEWFEKSYSTDKMNDSPTIKRTRRYKKSIEKPIYNYNFLKSKKYFKFSNTVCIKNLGYNEYLIVKDVFDLENNNTAVTWYFDEKHSNRIWELEKFTNKYKINHFSSQGVYLYAVGKADDISYNSDQRQVTLEKLSCFGKECNPHNSLWILEPYGDAFYIRNHGLNSYLYAADSTENNVYHSVYTWIPNVSEISVETFLWVIENCTSI